MFVKGIPISQMLQLTADVTNSEEFKQAIANFNAGRVVDTSQELLDPASIHTSTKRDVLIKALGYLVDYDVKELPFNVTSETEILLLMLIENSLSLCSNFNKTSGQYLRDIFNPISNISSKTINISYTHRISLEWDEEPWWKVYISQPSYKNTHIPTATDYSNIWTGFISSYTETSVPLFEEKVIAERKDNADYLKELFKSDSKELNLYKLKGLSNSYVQTTYPYHTYFFNYDSLISKLELKISSPDKVIDGELTGSQETATYYTEMYSDRKVKVETEDTTIVTSDKRIVLSEPTIIDQLKSIDILKGTLKYVGL